MDSNFNTENQFENDSRSVLNGANSARRFASNLYKNRNKIVDTGKKAIKTAKKVASVVTNGLGPIGIIIGSVFMFLLIIAVIISSICYIFVSTDMDEKVIYQSGIDNIKGIVKPAYETAVKKYQINTEITTLDDVSYTIFIGCSAIDSAIEQYVNQYDISVDGLKDAAMGTSFVEADPDNPLSTDVIPTSKNSGVEVFSGWLSKNKKNLIVKSNNRTSDGYEDLGINLSSYRSNDLRYVLSEAKKKETDSSIDVSKEMTEFINNMEKQTDEMLKEENVGNNTRLLDYCTVSFSQSGELNANYGENSMFRRGTLEFSHYYNEMRNRGFYLALGYIQCVDMARFCLQEYYPGCDLSPTGNGNQFAQFLINAYPDKFESTSEIKSGSFISMNSDGYGSYDSMYGHIQYVQKVDGDNIWVIEGLPGIDAIQFNRRMTLSEVAAQHVCCIASPKD